MVRGHLIIFAKIEQRFICLGCFVKIAKNMNVSISLFGFKKERLFKLVDRNFDLHS